MTEWEQRERQPSLVLVDSYGNKGKGHMPAYFAAAFWCVLYNGLRGRIGLLHLHMAECGSVLRKGMLVWLARLLGVPAVVHVHGTPLPARTTQSLQSTANLSSAIGRAWSGRPRPIAPAARQSERRHGPARIPQCRPQSQRWRLSASFPPRRPPGTPARARILLVLRCLVRLTANTAGQLLTPGVKLARGDTVPVNERARVVRGLGRRAEPRLQLRNPRHQRSVQATSGRLVGAGRGGEGILVIVVSSRARALYSADGGGRVHRVSACRSSEPLFPSYAG